MATTPNLNLPIYEEGTKLSYLNLVNDTNRKIDAFAGETKATGDGNTSAITSLQEQQTINTRAIGENTGDIALIKTNQTAVNKHLTDVDTEINSLDDRVTALEDGTTGGESYTKAESDAKFATNEALQGVSATATAAQTAAERADNATIVNATAITAIDANLTSGDVKFRFGVDDQGNYGYYKAGADTVTPFSIASIMPDTFSIKGTGHFSGVGYDSSGSAGGEGNVDIGGVIYSYQISGSGSHHAETPPSSGSYEITITFTKQE